MNLRPTTLRTVRRLAPALLVASLALTATPAIGSPTQASPMVRAIVVARPGAQLPVNVPGGQVLDVFHSLGSELVRLPAAMLGVLAHDARVAGISPDARGRVSGFDNSGSADGVLAADTLGGVAGRPGTGKHVNVALLDTGVSDTAALDRASGRLVDGVDVSQLSAGGPALTTGPFTDGFGHGTFLASLIAGGRVPGSGDRAVGVAPAAHVVVVKVADDEGNTSLAQVLAGLDWVAAHAPAIQVVNIALAVDRPTGDAYGLDPLTAGVEHVRAAGVTVVAAAGNQPGQVGDPGLDPTALTVGAADVSAGAPAVAPFSGSGVVDGVQKPDVVAPGVHVLGVINRDSLIARDHPDGWKADGLFRGSGTSEATAIASGVAAAYIGNHHGADPLDVKSALRRNAEPLASDAAGRGLVQMATSDNRPGSAEAAGESTLDEQAWTANAWDGVPDWQSQLASMWSATTWSATTWSATTWSATTWSATTWSATTWSATTWSATSWSDYDWGRT